VQIKFAPEEISYKEVLEIFFGTHDPTTLNRQGNDVGSSYRSVVFYHSDEQKETADEVIEEITNEGIFDDDIVTEVTEFTKFYPAEDYHQDYFAKNPNQPYCAAVVSPKVGKFRKNFAHRLKT
jgi:peptide-methionine (S)-S-oxide reductase